MSHTPGPWYWNDSANLDRLFGRNENGETVAILAHDMESYVGKLREDDARLIASSPDLLDALRRMCDWYVEWRREEFSAEVEPQYDPLYFAAQAAIAKATGEETG